MRAESKRRYGRRVRLSMVTMLLLSAVLAGMVGPAAGEESISVSCYVGDRSLGTVVVFDVQLGPQACSDMYYDCRGRCVACYHDFDYVDYVCIDTRGNTFLK